MYYDLKLFSVRNAIDDSVFSGQVIGIGSRFFGSWRGVFRNLLFYWLSKIEIREIFYICTILVNC